MTDNPTIIQPWYSKGRGTHLPWKIAPRADDSATLEFVFESKSLLLTDTSGIVLERLPFQKDFWLQYNLAILPDGDPKHIQTRPGWPFLSHHFSAVPGPNSSYFTADARIRFDAAGTPFLLYRLRPLRDPGSIRELTGPLTFGNRHCVETHYAFGNDDSLRFELMVDNGPKASVTLPFVDRREFIETSLSNIRSAAGHRLSLSGMMLSPKRLRAFPPVPLPGPAGLDSTGIPFLSYALPVSRFRGETVKAVQWRLFKAGDSLPLFNDATEDPSLFARTALTFDLDSGLHEWQVRSKNNFGNWSDWSQRKAFPITHRKLPFFEITGLSLTAAGSPRPVQSLLKGEWVQVRLKLDSRGRPWQDFGYAIVWLSGPGFDLGHPGNKGGPFSSRGNYVLNFARDIVNNAAIIECYEKKTENSFFSEPLPAGKRGLYFDADSQLTRLDTALGELTLAFRLLDNAAPGPWRIRAYTAGTRKLFNLKQWEARSSVAGQSIEVADASPSQGWLAGLIAALATAGAAIILRRREKTPPLPNPRLAEDYRKLTDYLNVNLADEALDLPSVRKALFFPRDYAYEVLKSGGQGSLPQLLNNLRVRKAETLLRDPAKNISEISYSVGFSDPRYFAKVFKSQKGLTPSEYRDQRK